MFSLQLMLSRAGRARARAQPGKQVVHISLLALMPRESGKVAWGEFTKIAAGLLLNQLGSKILLRYLCAGQARSRI
jgi:hypothetical protein